MSEEATGVAVEAPPVEAPVVEAPVVETPAVEIERESGAGHQGARRNVRKRAERAAARAEANAVVAEAARQRALPPRVEAGRPEGGQFTKEGAGEEPAVSPEVVAEAPTEQTPVAGDGSQVDVAGTDKAPAGWVDIPIPEGHPLRDRGRTKIRALKEEETDVRNGINAAVRLREAESERDRLARDVALLEARREALSGDLPDLDADPVFRAMLEQIEAAPGFGPEKAEQIRAWRAAAEEARIMKATQEVDSRISMQRTAQQVAGDIESRAEQIFEVWTKAGETQQRLRGPNGLIAQYYRAVDQRNERDGVSHMPKTDEFLVWARQAYSADPRVKTAIEQIRQQDKVRSEEAIRAKVRAELAEEQRVKAEAAAVRHSVRPPTSRALPSSSTPSIEGAEVRTPPKHGNHRQAAKERIRSGVYGQ